MKTSWMLWESLPFSPDCVFAGIPEVPPNHTLFCGRLNNSRIPSRPSMSFDRMGLFSFHIYLFPKDIFSRVRIIDIRCITHSLKWREKHQKQSWRATINEDQFDIITKTLAKGAGCLSRKLDWREIILDADYVNIGMIFVFHCDPMSWFDLVWTWGLGTSNYLIMKMKEALRINRIQKGQDMWNEKNEQRMLK